MRWFRRRHLATAEVSVIEHDGIRYDARAMYRPQGGGGGWQKFAARVRRSYAVFAGRGQEEDRALTSVPWSVGDTLTPTSASQSQALRLGAVWSAVRLICDTVSTLPIKSYRKSGEARTPAPLPALFRQLDEDGTIVPWLWRCVSSLMLRGNAYGLITSRDGFQYPTVIQWLDPDEVSCDDTNPWAPIWYWRGQVVPIEDFVHIPWFVVAGKVQGLSPIEAYALSVSTGLQAQEYGATWFSNGGVPPGTMKNTRQTIDRGQADAISDRLVSAIKRRRPIVYGADWEFDAISVPPEQSQFLETINASASQIASIYGIPPEYVGGSTGDSMTYATVEQNAIRLNQALRPLLVRLDNAFSALMPNKQRVKLNADATARADLKTRLEAYEIALRTGLYTIDEIRTLEDLPPLPAGAPRPMLQPAPQSQRWNPHQKRDPDGQFSDGVFSPKRAGTFGRRLSRAAQGEDALSAATFGLDRGSRHEDFTLEMSRAVNTYTGAEYNAVNRHLRDQTMPYGYTSADVEPIIEEVDRAMKLSSLSRETVTYRGVGNARGMFGDHLDNDLTGLEWREEAYVSTSAKESKAQGFAGRNDDSLVMRVLSPAGTPAIEGSGMDLEAELVLGRGQRMRIVADRGFDPEGRRQVDVEVLGD